MMPRLLLLVGSLTGFAYHLSHTVGCLARQSPSSLHGLRSATWLASDLREGSCDGT
jgi:hypothetical protein